MNEIWVLRPGALGDTILALPLLERVVSNYDGHKIVFWGSTEYAAVIREFFPQIEFRSFQSLGLLPLFTCDFVISDLKMQHPSKIFAILKKDKLVEKNLNLICSQVVWSEINKENKVWVVEQLQSMEATKIPLDFSFIKQVNKGSKLLIHMGTGSSTKLMPASFWETLIPELKEQYSITLLYGPAENKMVFQNDLGVESLKNISLKELINKMKDFQYYMGLDSGVSHLAGVMGLKGLAFFHATDPVYWRPMGNVKPFVVEKQNLESWKKVIGKITNYEK